MYLRLNAEFDNLRKRTLKEREEFIKYANEKLIQEFIDVFESLERGIENARKTDNKDKLIEGMELVYKQFKVVLERNGLVPIKALGEKFDHSRHEAMMQTLTDVFMTDCCKCPAGYEGAIVKTRIFFSRAVVRISIRRWPVC